MSDIIARCEKAMADLSTPALATVDVPLSDGYAAAKTTLLAKLDKAFEHGRGYGRPLVCSVRAFPEQTEEKARWTIGHRAAGMAHTVDPERVVYVRFVHGGPRLQACYYFEWDGTLGESS